MSDIVGVLGGMGPLATADFMRKLTELTPAATDQDHIPVIAYSVPQIPDRSASILAGSNAPLKAMRKGKAALEKAGATSIVIPCNTAHYWYDDLSHEGTAHILHIVDAVAAALKDLHISEGPIGLLATTGTIHARVYQNRLRHHNLDCIAPDSSTQENEVMRGIKAVKAGDLQGGREALSHALHSLQDAGSVSL